MSTTRKQDEENKEAGESVTDSAAEPIRPPAEEELPPPPPAEEVAPSPPAAEAVPPPPPLTALLSIADQVQEMKAALSQVTVDPSTLGRPEEKTSVSILTDPAWRGVRDGFLAHAGSEHSSENLDFLIEAAKICDKYDTSLLNTDDKNQELFQGLVVLANEFIGDDAPRQVNLSGPTLQQVTVAREDLQLRPWHLIDCIHDVRNLIQRDSFNRAARSDVYGESIRTGYEAARQKKQHVKNIEEDKDTTLVLLDKAENLTSTATKYRDLAKMTADTMKAATSFGQYLTNLVTKSPITPITDSIVRADKFLKRLDTLVKKYNQSQLSSSRPMTNEKFTIYFEGICNHNYKELLKLEGRINDAYRANPGKYVEAYNLIISTQYKNFKDALMKGAGASLEQTSSASATKDHPSSTKKGTIVTSSPSSYVQSSSTPSSISSKLTSSPSSTPSSVSSKLTSSSSSSAFVSSKLSATPEAHESYVSPQEDSMVGSSMIGGSMIGGSMIGDEPSDGLGSSSPRAREKLEDLFNPVGLSRPAAAAAATSETAASAVAKDPEAKKTETAKEPDKEKPKSDGDEGPPTHHP